MKKSGSLTMNNEKGFTLVEIIAVLIILGILAAVAVPKYFDLQDNARNKAVEGALAEGVGRINAHFGQAVLGGSTPGGVVYSNTTLGTDAGDFSLGYVVTNDTITVTATGTAASVLNATTSKDVPKPGTVD